MRIALVIACLAAGVAPASATDVTFSGTLSGVCTLALSTPGILGLAADGSLGTSAGVPAILTILSVGANTVTINPPVWVSTPGGYSAGTEAFQVGYLGLSGLGLADQALTSSITTRTISTLPLSLLTMQTRVTNSLGFAAGAYSMKVVVTCS
ncbi:MAG: hypothetical protein ABIQ30_03625 [Devosia sp.]